MKAPISAQYKEEQQEIWIRPDMCRKLLKRLTEKVFGKDRLVEI